MFLIFTLAFIFIQLLIIVLMAIYIRHCCSNECFAPLSIKEHIVALAVKITISLMLGMNHFSLCNDYNRYIYNSISKKDILSKRKKNQHVLQKYMLVCYRNCKCNCLLRQLIFRGLCCMRSLPRQ